MNILLAALYRKLCLVVQGKMMSVERAEGGTYDALLTQLQSYISRFFLAPFGGRTTALVSPFYFVYFMDGISLVRNTEQQLCSQ